MARARAFALTMAACTADARSFKMVLTKWWQEHDEYLPQLPVPPGSKQVKLLQHVMSSWRCIAQMQDSVNRFHLPTTPAFLGSSRSTPKLFRKAEVELGCSAQVIRRPVESKVNTVLRKPILLVTHQTEL